MQDVELRAAVLRQLGCAALATSQRNSPTHTQAVRVCGLCGVCGVCVLHEEFHHAATRVGGCLLVMLTTEPKVGTVVSEIGCLF